jgi:hypothetical protein
MEKMKNQGIAFLLTLCWIIGMSAVFSFPPKIASNDIAENTSAVIGEIQGPQIHFRTVADSPQVPSFKIDWSLIHKFNSIWIPDFRRVLLEYLAPAFFQKSRALFDVKETFIRFFYTW